jgi:hypothetical protein
MVLKSWSLILLEPLGPAPACNWIALCSTSGKMMVQESRDILIKTYLIGILYTEKSHLDWPGINHKFQRTPEPINQYQTKYRIGKGS